MMATAQNGLDLINRSKDRDLGWPEWHPSHRPEGAALQPRALHLAETGGAARETACPRTLTGFQSTQAEGLAFTAGNVGEVKHRTHTQPHPVSAQSGCSLNAIFCYMWSLDIFSTQEWYLLTKSVHAKNSPGCFTVPILSSMSRYYYLHFTNEKTNPQRLSGSSKVRASYIRANLFKVLVVVVKWW